MASKSRPKGAQPSGPTLWNKGNDGADRLVATKTLKLPSPKKLSTGRRGEPSSSKARPVEEEEDDVGNESVDPLGLWGDTGTQFHSSKKNMAGKNPNTFGGRRHLRPNDASESEESSSDSGDASNFSDSEVSEAPRPHGQKKKAPPRGPEASSGSTSKKRSPARNRDAAPKSKPKVKKTEQPAPAPFPMGSAGKVQAAALPSVLAPSGSKSSAQSFPMSPPKEKRRSKAIPESPVVISDDDTPKAPQKRAAPFPMSDSQMQGPPARSSENSGSSHTRESSFFTHRSQPDDTSSDDIQLDDHAPRINPSRPNSSSSSQKYSDAETETELERRKYSRQNKNRRPRYICMTSPFPRYTC